MESTNLHELGTEIFAAFSELSGVQDIATRFIGKRLISEEQRFRLWAHSLGLHNQGHSSLDYRVRDAVVVKSRLADLLSELKDHLENLGSVQSGERQPFEVAAAVAAANEGAASDRDSDARSTATTSTSPSLSSDGTSFHEVDFRMESMTETLDALYSLATKIKNPRNRPQRAVEELYKHVPAQVRKETIQEREEVAIAIICHVQRQELLEGLQHGELEASGRSHHEILKQYALPSNWLVRRAGLANARRKQQFVYWAEHAARIRRGSVSSELPPRADQSKHNDGPAADEEQPVQTQPGWEGHMPAQLDFRASLSRSLATSATRLDETFIKLDDLNSVISHQSRVSTVMNLRGENLEWPSPPVQTTSSGFFTCPYCKIICPRKYLTKEAWRVHLIHDLQPYHCTFEHCHDSNRIYGTRQEWLEHESFHVRVWHCTFHGEEFETQPEYTAHLHEKHSELGAEYFSPELIAAGVGPSRRLHRDCPFCPTAFSDAIRHDRELDSHEGQRRGRVGSIEGDFADEEQLLFRDVSGSAASDRPGPTTAMADIQEAVGRREEEMYLTQWLADQLHNEPNASATTSETQEQQPPYRESLEGPRHEIDGQELVFLPNPYCNPQNETFAPTEEHFPFLPHRSPEENFNYRPNLSH